MKKDSAKRKVVIAEDDHLLAIILKRMASSLNFDILHISRSGENAILSIQENKPDLVFMDIHLEDKITGIEAMKKVRESSDVPVIYITAESDPKVQKDAKSVGNALYILKPVNFKELQNALSRIQFAA